MNALIKYAVCVDNDEYPASLELHKVYELLPDDEAAKDGDLRVIDESGEDYLFPASCFEPVDVSERISTSLLSQRNVTKRHRNDRGARR